MANLIPYNYLLSLKGTFFLLHRLIQTTLPVRVVTKDQNSIFKHLMKSLIQILFLFLTNIWIATHSIQIQPFYVTIATVL